MMSGLDGFDDAWLQLYFGVGNFLFKDDEILPKLTAIEIEVLHYLITGKCSNQDCRRIKFAFKIIDTH